MDRLDYAYLSLVIDQVIYLRIHNRVEDGIIRIV